MIVNISEAKMNLSKLVNLAFHGEEVIIAKNNLPLVELVVHTPKNKVIFGLLSDKQLDHLDHEIMNESDQVNDLFFASKIEPE